MLFRKSKPKTVVSAKTSWDQNEGFRRRQYESYEQYIEHQASKLATLNLTRYSEQFRKELLERLEVLPAMPRGSTVLCLGARNGVECEAFIQKGFFAVGIDLNPGENNKTVLSGDFHDLQFADASVDIVFTNAIDHAFHLEKMLAEIKRVLKSRGTLIAEIVRGSRDLDGREPGDFESAWWDSADEVIDRVNGKGFALGERRRFNFPWNGDQCIFIST